MDAKNLAIIFGGIVFGEDEIPQSGDLMLMQMSSVSNISIHSRRLYLIPLRQTQDTLMEDIIENAHVLFDERPPTASPPLPPPPMGEPVPVYPLGSSHTQVTNISPPPTSSDDSGSYLPVSAGPEPDFTPELPPRPANSIHPAARRDSAMSPQLRPASLLIPSRPQSAIIEEDIVQQAYTAISYTKDGSEESHSSKGSPPRPASAIAPSALGLDTVPEPPPKRYSLPRS